MITAFRCWWIEHSNWCRNPAAETMKIFNWIELLAGRSSKGGSSWGSESMRGEGNPTTTPEQLNTGSSLFEAVREGMRNAGWGRAGYVVVLLLLLVVDYVLMRRQHVVKCYDNCAALTWMCIKFNQAACVGCLLPLLVSIPVNEASENWKRVSGFICQDLRSRNALLDESILEQICKTESYIELYQKLSPWYFHGTWISGTLYSFNIPHGCVSQSKALLVWPPQVAMAWSDRLIERKW